VDVAEIVLAKREDQQQVFVPARDESRYYVQSQTRSENSVRRYTYIFKWQHQ